MAIRTSYIKTTREDKTSTFAGGLTINGDFGFGDAITDTLTVSGILVCSAQGVQNPLSVGTWATPIALSTTVTRAALINATVTAKSQGFVRAAEIRALVTGSAAFDAADSTYGLRGTGKWTPTSALTVSNHVLVGVLGNLEIDSSANVLTLNGDTVQMAGVVANVEIGASTVCTDGNVSGLLVKSNTPDAVDVSGLEYDGIAIKKDSGKEDWQKGIRIEDSVTGIEILTPTTGIVIGASTTGISLSGTNTTGISISGQNTTGIDITGGGTVTTGIDIGDCTAGIAFTGTTARALSFVTAAGAANSGNKGSTAGGYLTVYVDGATRYINCVTGA